MQTSYRAYNSYHWSSISLFQYKVKQFKQSELTLEVGGWVGGWIGEWVDGSRSHSEIKQIENRLISSQIVLH